MKHVDLELAHRLLHQQLDPPSRAAWERHVASCGRCQAVLTAERNWMSVLSLAQDPAPAVTAGMERLLARVADLTPNAAARRQRRNALLLGGIAAAILLANLLAWQTSNRSGPSAAALAAELRIPIELHNKVIANFDALVVLQRDPWMMEHHEAVRRLDDFIQGHQPQQ